MALLTCLLVTMGSYGWRWSTDAVRTEVFAFPDGRSRLGLRHDLFLGQVETLTVTRDADTPRARIVFTQVGDRPIAFVGWQDDQTALLVTSGQSGSPAYWLLLCGDETCRLGER